MNRFHRWIVFSLSALAFLAPLKFGTPVMIQSLALPPRGFFEWVFFPWPNQLAVILCFGVFIWLVLDPQRVLAQVDVLFLLPLLFLFTQGPAFLSAINHQVASDTLKLFAVCVLLFYVAAWYVRDGADTWRIFGGLGMATLLVCVLALEQYYGGLDRTREYAAVHVDPASVSEDFLARMSSNRVFATLVYPNALAGFLVLAFAPTIVWIWTRARGWDSRVRWAAVVLAGLMMFLSLVLTGSRGGFIAFGGAVGVALWCSLRRRAGRALMLVAIVLAALAGVFFVAKRAGFIRAGLGSIEARFDYWQGAVGIARDNPLRGTGPGTFGSIYPMYKTAETEEAQAVHNNFLQMWSDSGILAFFVFAALWLVAVRDAYWLTRQRMGDAAAVAVCASLTGWVIHGFVDFDLYVPGIAIPAFILLGAVQGLKEFRRTGPVTARGRTKWLFVSACLIVVCAVVWIEGRALAADFANGRAHELEERDLTAAYEEAKRAVALAPRNALYQTHAGNIALKLGDHNEAIGFFHRAIEEDPYRASNYWRLAQANMAGYGVNRRTLDFLWRAAQLNPTNKRYANALAEAEESVRHSAAGLLQSSPAKEE